MKVSLHFSEYKSDLRPDVAHWLHYFPGAAVHVLTEADMPEVQEIDPAHPRYGMRRRNLEQIRQMLRSTADVAIALDSDMRIVNDLARDLPGLAMKFGLCVPANPRELIQVDTERGVDSDGLFDGGRGGMAVNYSPMAFATGNHGARQLLEAAEFAMLKRPTRGTLLIPHAEWRTGLHAYRLPRQWCVCQEDVNIASPIMLHTGHERVRKFFGVRK